MVLALPWHSTILFLTSFPACTFGFSFQFKVKISSCIPVALFQVRISPQWLSKLRQLWTNDPWWVVCEHVSLICSHIIPEQRSQPTTISMGQVCVTVSVFRFNLQPALFTEWPGFFLSATVLKKKKRGGGWGVEWTLNKSQHRKINSGEKMSHHSCQESNLQPFYHESGTLQSELSQPKKHKFLLEQYKPLSSWEILVF